MDNFLIFIICNDGFADEVMELAKENGARGGTVLKARGTASAETIKFFNITIQPEKQIILIIANEETKEKIMKNISKEKGAHTPARALSFAIKVDDTVGLPVN